IRKQGFIIGRDRLRQLLKNEGLLFKARKKRLYVKTTDSRHPYLLYPNLLKGLFIQRPEQAWVADITYIRVQGVPLYLALVSDAYSRKIMGWNLSEKNTSHSACKALQYAWDNRTYESETLLHHSDRGIQYCCGEYRML